MFDTPITVVGNVLTAPQWRRTTQTGTFMVTFRVASTSRRYVREREAWVDGDSLRVRVTCWRRLAENVSVSVQLGDPVVVHGRLYTRDWVDDSGARRTSYELEAISVGHDLNRGVDKFARRRITGGTDMVEGPSADSRVGGELTEPVDDPGRPADLPADHQLFEPFDKSIYDDSAFIPGGMADVVGAELRADPTDSGDPTDPGDAEGTEGSDGDEFDEQLVGAASASGGGRGRSGRSRS